MSELKKFDLYSPEFKAQPYETYANLRAENPVRLHQGMHIPIWFVTGYEEAKQVLADHKTFVKRYENALTPEEHAAQNPVPDVFEFIRNHLLGQDPPDHTRLRALVSKAFTIKRVNALRPRIQAIADELLDRVQAQGQMDLIDDYAFPLPVTVIAEMLGVPAEDQGKFREWSNALIETQRTAAEQEAFQQHMMAFIYYMGQLFAERRAHPQDDLISALIQAEEAGERLSHEELFSMVLILLVAGHETTVNLIGNGILALMKHPNQMRMLQNDWGLVDTAVSEILRYDGPAERATTRWAAKDTLFCGQQIKRKDPIIVILGAANHDPAQFREPEGFDILRDSSSSLAFGYGIHYCVGAPLARLEGEIAFRTLLQRMPDIHLASPETELEWRASTILRGLKHMPVVWDT